VGEELKKRISLCGQIVLKINQKMAENRISWFSVGVALYNSVGEFGKEIFHTFSKRSDKYTFECCETEWDKLVKNRDQNLSKYPHLNLDFLKKSFNYRKRILN
jgi:hypothetical protein